MVLQGLSSLADSMILGGFAAVLSSASCSAGGGQDSFGQDSFGAASGAFLDSCHSGDAGMMVLGWSLAESGMAI